MFVVLLIRTISCYITQSCVNYLITLGPHWSRNSSRPVPDYSQTTSIVNERTVPDGVQTEQSGAASSVNWG